MSELKFRLKSETDWPPVSVECIPAVQLGQGYLLEKPPFFVPDLSAGDLIEVESEEDEVTTFRHIKKSARSTIWVMAFDSESVRKALDKLLARGCNIEALVDFSYYSIDVPEACSLDDIDNALGSLSEDQLAVAFPSLRHSEAG